MSEEVEVKEEAKDAAAAGAKRMSDADFAEAKELYELGKAGLSELADQFGVSRQALSQRLKSAGAVKGSRAHEVAAAAKKAVTGAAGSSAAATAERFADKRGEWIEETRITGFRQLKLARQLAQKVVQDALAAGRSIATTDDELKAVMRLNKILCDNIESTLNLLEADKHVDQNDLPSLNIEDLTNEDILKHHIGTGALPEGSTVEDMLADEADPGLTDE
ncbi:HTH - DNA binding domain-containing protein [Rhizobium phage B1VFA]|nr:HTH - DNA binding domain-containing protein [Rhizobium phage B1VFA]